MANSSDKKTFHEFYVKDLEAKLDAYRARELSLAEELERARILIISLQKENSIMVDREREMIMMQVRSINMLV